MTVRAHTAEGYARPSIPEAPMQGRAATAQAQRAHDADSAEVRALDEEIAFRQAPVFEEPAEPATPLPANLIEFPRQLVAPRKARPRYAEGPLREDADAAPDNSQLRIFEVEQTQISADPAAEDATPEWSSIWLDAIDPNTVAPALDDDIPAVPLPSSVAAAFHATGLEHLKPAAAVNDRLNYKPRPQAAPFSRRIMASTVDFCVVGFGFLGFATTFALTVGRTAVNAAVDGQRPGTALIVSAIATFALLNLGYKALFFTFAESTPGMAYARIGLCTLNDENPTRPAMRRRILAVLLSSCAMGIGFLWALFDADGLSLHDRISGMYQRSY
jgi:uncharacterized RDD family membrane protein YckC